MLEEPDQHLVESAPIPAVRAAGWERAAGAGFELPREFDLALYSAHPGNEDLRHLDLDGMRAHYDAAGRREGRVCSVVDGRAAFLGLIPAEAEILEIGPFAWPCFPPGARKVRYLDVLATEDLRRRAVQLQFDPSKVPPIDYVWRGEPYRALVQQRVDAVISSHCIEHQPCLLTHLTDVAALLKPEGRFFAVIPDKRFCFDHFFPETTLAEVLDAFASGRTRHSHRSVLQHQLLLTHNDAEAHWRGEHGEDPCRQKVTGAFAARVAESLRGLRGDSYVDVHAWQFTPDSFRILLDGLADIGLSPFRVERVYETVRNQNEFYAILHVAE